MKVLAIVQVDVLRMLRDRRALFFSVILPFILILVLGLAFGANNVARVGIFDADGSALSAQLEREISSSRDVVVEIVDYPSIDELRYAAAHGIVQAALAIPAGYEATLEAGNRATLTEVVSQTQAAGAIQTLVDRAIASQAAAFEAAQFVASDRRIPFSQALAQASAAQSQLAGVSVTVEAVGAPTLSVSGFQAGAQSQLILFMFLTSLTGATELVAARRLGISRRMYATPTPVRTIIVGESLARIAIAVMQGLLIVFASAALFGVAWGDPLATAAVVFAFAVVAGGAAMLVGTLARNESQAGALGPALGMLLALFGGAMVPVEVFPQTLRTLSWITPHAWAMDALITLRSSGEGLVAVLPQLGVLAVFAVVVLGLAIARFRRVLSQG